MGKHSEQHQAARQFYADAQPMRSAREECEAGEDAAAVALDEWTEKLMRNGDVPRVYAQKCAGVVVEVLRARDAACVAGVRGAASGRGAAELFAGIGRVVEEIVGASDAGGKSRSKFSAGCLLLAMGNYTYARSARDWAERVGLSHELVSNAVEAWQERLGLPRTSGQKSEAAVKAYRETNGKTKLAA